MASQKFTSQQITKVSLNKSKLIDLAGDITLDEKDYRVIIFLMTELEGWALNPNYVTDDPKNFKKIDIKKIARVTGMKKKDVKCSLDNLMRAGFIDEGVSDTVSKGYRFTF